MEHEEQVYHVIVAQAVNDRMAGHFEFLARVSENAATRLLENLLKDIHSLETMPYRNPIYERPYLPQGKYRYMISCNRYLIVYRINDEYVFVDDIQDSRQDDDKSLLNDITV